MKPLLFRSWIIVSASISHSGERESKKQKRRCVSVFKHWALPPGDRRVLLGYPHSGTLMVRWAPLCSSALRRAAVLFANHLRCPAQSSPALHRRGCREGRASSRTTPASYAALFARSAGTVGLASGTRRGRRLRSPHTWNIKSKTFKTKKKFGKISLALGLTSCIISVQ